MAGEVAVVKPVEALDDVQEVFANFDIPEQLLEAVASQGVRAEEAARSGFFLG